MWHHLSRSRSISAIPCPMEHGQGMGERCHMLPWGRALHWGTASTRSPQPLPASLLPVAAVPSCPETRTPRWATGLGGLLPCRGLPGFCRGTAAWTGQPHSPGQESCCGSCCAGAGPGSAECPALPAGAPGGEAPLIHCKCQITNRF